jgi:hypothetical protein
VKLNTSRVDVELFFSQAAEFFIDLFRGESFAFEFRVSLIYHISCHFIVQIYFCIYCLLTVQNSRHLVP